MSESAVTRGEAATFRVDVWSPLNDGRALLELEPGATVEDLLRTLSKVWGTEFLPEKGYGGDRGVVAGWCVLCEAGDGQFMPLPLTAEVPPRPLPAPSGPDGGYEAYCDWRQDLYGRTCGPGFPWEAARWQGFISPKALDGYLEEVPRGFVRGGDFGGALRSAPWAGGAAPSADADVRLVVLIAVTGT